MPDSEEELDAELDAELNAELDAELDAERRRLNGIRCWRRWSWHDTMARSPFRHTMRGSS